MSKTNRKKQLWYSNAKLLGLTALIAAMTMASGFGTIIIAMESQLDAGLLEKAVLGISLVVYVVLSAPMLLVARIFNSLPPGILVLLLLVSAFIWAIIIRWAYRRLNRWKLSKKKK